MMIHLLMEDICHQIKLQFIIDKSVIVDEIYKKILFK